MLGYTASEIIGKQNPLFFHDMPEIIEFCRNITGNSHPTEKEIYETALQNMFQKTTEWTWVRKNGAKFPIRITHSEIIDDNGTLIGYMGLIVDITEERKAVDALRESEERFQHLFLDHAAVMLLINPETGEIIGANKSAERFYGFSFNTPIRRNISEINALPIESVNKELTSASNRDQSTFIFPHRLKSGETRMVEVHSSPIEVKGSRILFSIIHDITDRMVAESALKKSEAENRAIIQAVPDLMFRISRDGTYLDAHCQNDSSLYVPKEAFIGKKIIEILPPDLAEKSMNSIRKAFSTDEIVQYEYKLAIKEKDYCFENRIIAISADEVLSIIRDITDRKESETALQMQSAAFESFALAIIITDINGYIQWSNSAFTRLTGYSGEEAKGKTPGQLVKSGKQDKAFYENLWNTILGEKVWTGELINRKKDGTLYYEEQTITPVLNSFGEIANFISIKIDITERKKIERSMIESIEREKELNELKSKFISITSHEFRTPLATIRASSDSLASYWDKMTSEQRELRLVKINDQVSQLTVYIDEMLHLSKLQNREKLPDPEQFDISGLFREIINEFCSIPENKGRVLLHTREKDIQVYLDRKEIWTILSNLVNNSLKYSPHHEKVSVTLSREGESVLFRVEDNGIGIPEKEIGRLFQPFFRASNTMNFSGTGLGLCIVKESVERQNGTILIESIPDRGTRVSVVLPLSLNLRFNADDDEKNSDH
jgi:PAS domain S-box-containing protein